MADEQTLKDFLHDVQADVNKSKADTEDILNKELEERKNVLNLKILAIVDISGSISRAQFNGFMNQIDLIRGLSKVKVIETDERPVAVYDYFKAHKNQIVRFQGGGGTHFRKAVQLANKAKPDVIVFMTDGCDGDSLKDCKPDAPVAWVVTQNGHIAYDWGTVVTKINQ